jgi:hypothetical protein
VYSFGVLHHTPDIKQSIKNIYNLLSEGGTFKLMLYAKNSWKYFCIKEANYVATGDDYFFNVGLVFPANLNP